MGKVRVSQWHSERVKVTVIQWHWQWLSDCDSDTVKVTMTQWQWHSESDSDTMTVTQLQWKNIWFLLLVYLSDGFQAIAEGTIAQQRKKEHGHTLLDTEVVVLYDFILPRNDNHENEHPRYGYDICPGGCPGGKPGLPNNVICLGIPRWYFLGKIVFCW